MTSVSAAAAEVRRLLVGSGAPADAASVAAAYRQVSSVRSPTRFLSELRLVEAELLGAGPLQALLDDDLVSDVLVHAGGQVWVDRGTGLTQSAVELGDGSRGSGERAARALAVRLVTGCGRRLDEALPFADAVIPSGHRVHVVIPPISPDGTCLSIRAVRPQRFDLAALERVGTVHPVVTRWLHDLVTAGVSTVVSGETGAGKTTLLGALIAIIDPTLRVVVIEDTSELRPRHPQAVRLQSRPPNVEGAGEVSLRQLVRQALRMRPDRIVLGEVRGAEIVDLLLAMNTGHRGGLCTVHANRTADVPARLEALCLLAGIPRRAVHALLPSVVQVVVHLRRVGGKRRITEVGVLRERGDGYVEGLVALRVDGEEIVRGPGYSELERRLADAAGIG